jgi:endonuclease G, mitochondrial
VPGTYICSRASDKKLCDSIANATKKLASPRNVLEKKNLEVVFQNDSDRLSNRMALLDEPKQDPNGLERLIGESNLCSISFLARGLEAAAAVARIRGRDTITGQEFFGTGFLVAPGLLMTNHHVLPNKSTAEMAVVEFNFQNDSHGIESQKFVFHLTPGVVFVTDSSLDVTFVEVVPRSQEGKQLSDFGFLPLLRHSGKALDREWVSIIQHPNGQPKQIAIRDSQIISLSREGHPDIDFDRYIHYTTDTQPGSSGSPVLNDQWQVVALHHRGVPKVDRNGNVVFKNKSHGAESMASESEVVWVANEGIRVSAICQWLQEQRYTSNMHDSAFHRVRFGVPRSVVQSSLGEVGEESTNPVSSSSDLAKRKGYQADFLSKHVALPTVKPKRKSAIAVLKGTKSETELKYMHFSVVFDQNRRFACFTAVNIDGNRLKQNSGVDGTWKRDGRIELDVQCGNEFYAKKFNGVEFDEVVSFQRGHLVRRVDPSWGTAEESVQAIKDTFHFTNACPHTGEFNDRIWGNLEDYLLEKCDREKRKMSVFSGPIFRSSDPKTYGSMRPGGPFRVPVDFWKVAVIEKDGDLAAAGFIIGQKDSLNDLEAGPVFTGLHPFKPSDLISQAIQVKIEKVEQLTNLDFGKLRDHQSATGLESTSAFRYLFDPAEIMI